DVGEAEDLIDAGASAAGSLVEQGDLDAALAEDPLGYGRGLFGRGLILRMGAAAERDGRGGGERSGLEERPAIGAAFLVVSHRGQLQIGGFSGATLRPSLGKVENRRRGY